MKKLVADTDIPYLKGVFEPFFNEVLYKKGHEIISDDLVNADALIVRTRTICNEKLLSGSSLKLIATATIGTDHIDDSYCKKKAIKVISAPGCNAGAVSQWVLSALLSLVDSEKQLKGKVLGVIGAGNIGNRVVEIGNALGMQVLVNDPPREQKEGKSFFTDIQTVFRESDVVTFHVPLTLYGPYSTYKLADKSLLNLLKENSIIINSSRGGVIDEISLLQCIKNKHIISLLDVWENEPLISTKLIESSSISTPHIAGYSIEGKVNATVKVVNEVSRFFGLGLEHWCPIPNPVEQKIEVNADKYFKNNDINLKLLLSFVYDITNDVQVLRLNPMNFESLRNNYHFRRENSAFKIVNIKNREWAEILISLGFSVVI